MFDIRDSVYFNSLPILTQESIMQCGMDFEDENKLRVFVDNLGTM